MRFLAPALGLLLAFSLAGCGGREDNTGGEGLNTRIVTLPQGQKIRAEILTNSEDMARGMMFRDSLASDRGMLFVHQQPGQYSYWMFQCKIPLDIIWMSADHKIVEISADTPPCKEQASRCPAYGGHRTSQYVLELAGGMAKKYGLKLGDGIDF